MSDWWNEIVDEYAYRRVSPLLAFFIFFVPVLFVWLLLRDGHTLRARIIGFGWLGFCLLTTLYIR